MKKIYWTLLVILSIILLFVIFAVGSVWYGINKILDVDARFHLDLDDAPLQGALVTEKNMITDKLQVSLLDVVSEGVSIVTGTASESDKKARDAIIKLGVSSLRSSAIFVAIEGKVSGEICNTLLGDPSEKSDWYWDTNVMCARDTLVHDTGLTGAGNTSNTGGVDGDLCCHASGSQWVVWGGLSGADGFRSNPPATNKDIYCADSGGFLGEVDLSISTHLNLGAEISCK